MSIVTETPAFVNEIDGRCWQDDCACNQTAFLQAEIVECARLLLVNGRNVTTREIRYLAAELLRMELEASIHVLVLDGDLFGEVVELIEIDRMRATVLFKGTLYNVPWAILRRASDEI